MDFSQQMCLYLWDNSPIDHNSQNILGFLLSDYINAEIEDINNFKLPRGYYMVFIFSNVYLYLHNNFKTTLIIIIKMRITKLISE